MDSPFINFVRLAQFSGYEPRRQFWPYAGVVIVAFFVIGPIVMMPVIWPMMSEIMITSMQSTSTPMQPGDPMPQGMQRAVASMFNRMMIATGIEVLLIVALLAAAVSRRLRDGGLSPYLGLMPVPFLLAGPPLFSTLMDSVLRTDELPAPLFLAALANNMIYIASLVMLIVLLCRRSKPQAAPASI